MDTFRLNPDAVRRAMPAPPTGETEPDTDEAEEAAAHAEAERLVERVREVEDRIPPADRPTAA